MERAMTDRRWLGLTIILAVLLAGAPARPSGWQDRPALPPEAIAELDQLLEGERTKAKVPGLSVAVGWKGRLVYSRGFGSADLEHRVAVTTTTAFRTASVAKPMTATAVMQLVEAGKIDLDRRG
jgi:CubicO group peptidase (beta-lactamase class C family)